MTPRTIGILFVALVLGIFAGIALQQGRDKQSAVAISSDSPGALLFNSVCANCHGPTGEGNIELKTSCHCSGTSSSGKMASTGHSGTQAPQSIHSSGSI